MTEKAYLGIWLETAAGLRREGASDAEIARAMGCAESDVTEMSTSIDRFNAEHGASGPQPKE